MNTMYPRVQTVRGHKHTCANVQIGSTYEDKCDCGALDTAGNAIPAPTFVPRNVREAVEFARADLGKSGSNYPHVRAMLAFIEGLMAE